MNSGNIVLIKTNTKLGKLASKLGNTYWTHINMMIDSKYTPDLALTHKQIFSLEELFEQPGIIDRKIINTSIPLENVYNLYNNFQQCKYETFKGLYRLKNKIKNGRDNENISSSDNHFICMSLIKKSIENLIPNDIHYSQSVPDDIFQYLHLLKYPRT